MSALPPKAKEKPPTVGHHLKLHLPMHLSEQKVLELAAGVLMQRLKQNRSHDGLVPGVVGGGPNCLASAALHAADNSAL
jgi:hypothetical protein